VLVSNLLIAAIDQSDMRELYGMRWGVEEGFKKYRHQKKQKLWKADGGQAKKEIHPML